MATTLDSETNLKITLKEEVIQNGVRQDTINTFTIPVKKIYRRIRTIGNVRLPWVNVDYSDPSGGTGFDTSNTTTQRSMRYFRVTNLDDTYTVDIIYATDAVAAEIIYRIPAGQSFVLPAHATTGWIDTLNAKGGHLDNNPDDPIGLCRVEFQTIDSGVKVDVEIFEASVDFV